MQAMFILTGLRGQLDQICKSKLFFEAKTPKYICSNDQFLPASCCELQKWLKFS